MNLPKSLSLHIFGTLLGVSIFCCSSAVAAPNATDKSMQLNEEQIKKIKDAQEAMSRRSAIENYVGGMEGKNKSELWKHYKAAGDLGHKDKYEDAIKELNMAIKAFDDPKEKALYKHIEMLQFRQAENYRMRAACYERLKKNQLAIDDLTQAIHFAVYSTPYEMRSRLLMAMGKKDDAIRDHVTATRLKPMPEFLFEQAKNFPERLQASAAISAALKGAQAKLEDKYYVGGSKGREASNFERLYRQARLLREHNEFAKAESRYTEAIDAFKDPKEQAVYKNKDTGVSFLASCYNGRAYCLLMQKDYNPAISDLSKCIEMRPKWRDSYINRAKAYHILGREAESKRDFATAEKLQPEMAIQ